MLRRVFQQAKKNLVSTPIQHCAKHTVTWTASHVSPPHTAALGACCHSKQKMDIFHIDWSLVNTNTESNRFSRVVRLFSTFLHTLETPTKGKNNFPLRCSWCVQYFLSGHLSNKKQVEKRNRQRSVAHFYIVCVLNWREAKQQQCMAVWFACFASVVWQWFCVKHPQAVSCSCKVMWCQVSTNSQCYTQREQSQPVQQGKNHSICACSRQMYLL